MKTLFLLLFILNIIYIVDADVKEAYFVSEYWEGGANRDFSGHYFDLIRLIYEPVGIKVNFDIFPYKRSVWMTVNKMADGWLCSYMDEVAQGVIYPKYEMDADNIQAFYRYDSPFEIKSEKDLKNKKLGWPRGYNFHYYFKSFNMNINEVVEVDNTYQGIKMVLGKRFDAYLDIDFEFQDAVKNLDLDKEDYKIANNMLYLKIYMGFSNTVKGKELAKIWDTRMKEILRSGEYRNLIKKSEFTDIIPDGK